MDRIDFHELGDLFDDDDSPPLSKEKIESYKIEIKEKTKYEDFQKQSVLGIDVLDYSQFPEPQQIFVPKILDKIIETALADIDEYEHFLFQNENLTEKIREKFIDQGDGGFFIVSTPLHAIILALYVESALRQFNSYNLMSKIRSIVGPIELRYSISFDTLYKYDAKWTGDIDKFYGPAIIHCARIMSKDKLDRCLMDNNSYLWFIEKFQGIEALKLIPFSVLQKLFPTYQLVDETAYPCQSFSIPEDRKAKESGISSVDVLKIGEIIAKKDVLSIYSVHIQMSFIHNTNMANEDGWKYYVISLGNLNPEGLILK
ncbi:hypothetical protein HGB47_14935 [Leptospira yasudae]|uniref:hypothetical protein n=1 Tax=Leptospira yasudae TaxID=2202201 RepID=UPI001C4ED601|nr:hypothetical protein [Leptospira yasudae]MBW0434912.1 hypothetical protein [Leptospira yasudae]